MKLLKNGELGIYIDTSHVKSLNTVELIDKEINNVALGNFDPVARENNTVVDPSDYIDFLQLRKSQLVQALKQQTVSVKKSSNVRPSAVASKDNIPSATASKGNAPSATTLKDNIPSATASKGNSPNEIDVLKKQLQHSTMIIKKLLELSNANVAEEAETSNANVAEEVETSNANVAEDAETSNANLAEEAETSNANVAEDTETHISSEIKANPVYNGELNMLASPANASIKGVFRDIIKNMDPDRKPSDFINVAVAIGLLGYDRARLIINELYNEDLYDKFLERLGDPNIDFSTTSITES
jgi:hypothetical protein